MSDNNGNADKAPAGEYVRHKDWAPEVRRALNDFIAKYGSASPGYDGTVYAVFDFDNTSSVFDVEHQLTVYMLQRMAFALRPEDITATLLESLSDPDEDLTRLGFGKGSCRDWAEDIRNAYAHLYEAYGPFTPAGLDDETAEKAQRDPWWKEFSAKMRTMFEVVRKHEPAPVPSLWDGYWLAGMTEQEVYDLGRASHLWFSKRETTFETWRSPADIPSRTGQVGVTWTSGIQVTENIRELMKALHDNGIKVWVCSASDMNVVRAGIDVFGLHDYVTGLLAITYRKENGKYTKAYDYDTGHGWLPAENGKWEPDAYPQNAITKGAGKVTAIENALRVRYGHGPAAGFMDNTGDFNVCTEYGSLRLVVCLNTADLPINDGGTLIAELAMYQRDTLHYDLERANAAGDTLYVLQGRDENGLRTLRPYNGTVKAGTDKEVLFFSEDSEKRLRYMKDNRMTTAEIINRFAVRTAADDPGNPLGFGYGPLSEYGGYHSRG